MKKLLKKHKTLINNYDEIKSKHLEKLATKLLKRDENSSKLKEKNIKGDYLKNF